MKEIIKIDPAVSIQMREIIDKVWEAEKMNNLPEETITSHICGINLKTRKKLNDMAYELAKDTGRSIWDICFSYAPDVEETELTFSNEHDAYKLTGYRNVKLVPVEHDLKFINLVKEMRKLQKGVRDIKCVKRMLKVERLVDKWLEGNHDRTDETMP